MSTNIKEEVVLVLITDRNYAEPTAVTLYSILSNIKKESIKLKLYVVNTGMEESQKRRFSRVIRKSSIDVKCIWKDFVIEEKEIPERKDWKTKSVYVPLWFSDIIPRYEKRIIYIDGDTIVNGDIYNLWKKKVGNNILAAVRDFFIPYVSSRWGIKRYKEIGMKSTDYYFNSGVMLINMMRWRKMSIKDKALKYISKYNKEMVFADQEALNVSVRQKWRQISPKWNVHYGLTHEDWLKVYEENRNCTYVEGLKNRREKILEQAKIIHFAGSYKPWKVSEIHDKSYLWYKEMWASNWMYPSERLISMARFCAQRYKIYTYNIVSLIRKWAKVDKLTKLMGIWSDSESY